ncbi:DEAD/DEAH box helicase [Canibacter zhoujuaniae]|uniref:DEAD/DEAH box helicase n=1 Tax=Canibacter zhoujuaniae TaxID=2708343 RepID=UPI001423D86B|nr:DEAD/DEAH box helicase [Canibacter zhoujuaniae]
MKRKHAHNEGIIPQLALAVREVEASAQRGKASPANRTRFHVVALIMRDERARVRDDQEISAADRAETLKRLDGIAGILAKTVAQDPSLLPLLEPEAPITEATIALKRKMLTQAGLEAPEEEPTTPAQESITKIVAPELVDRQVVPARVSARKLANPFLAPQLNRKSQEVPVVRLANWELISPLLKAFEQGGHGMASMELPEAPVRDRIAPADTELMPHQAKLLAAVRDGHRRFLLADEPGLGKTAQSLLAASVANSYPLLVVAPNVVKMNWAREAEKWTPKRRVSVITGDGEDVDVFADIFVINYDIVGRHLSWLGDFGFNGLVVDEAHMIKNVTSQRSRSVLALADRVRNAAPSGDPLLVALTGTPLINSIDDFRAIWQMLGWTAGEKPGPELLSALEATGLTPADGAFYGAARQAVIDLGVVRRRKIDVAKDLPAKRVIDLPIELDDAAAPGVQEAERKLANKLYDSYKRMRKVAKEHDYSDEQLIRMVCARELEADEQGDGVNVFSMVRQIGLAKIDLAVDYAAQLARSAGKVVFFAKHNDVMDRAEAAFAEHELKTTSIRGYQSATERQKAIDAFQTDPEVHVIVCSLSAAGVGVNLQASSNVVLAELSWTDAEQTQAIDRVHRIGQEEPVTAWRIIASKTIDQRIAELIDSKAGLAARALDGGAAQADDADSVQMRVLMSVLRQEIESRES